MSEEEKIKARERSRKYYQAHKEEILAKQYVYKKKKYKEDPEYRKKVYENSRRWIEKNPEKAYAIKRKWQVEHREPTKDEIIERLKDEIKEADEAVEYWQEQYDNLQQRIDKGIEYNKEIKNKIEKQLDNGQSYDFIVAGYLAIFHDTLVDILRGDE